VKARLVCPKCGGPLSAAITHATDEDGVRKRLVHYRCQDKACDGEIENPAEFRAFVHPPRQLTPLGRWLALNRAREQAGHQRGSSPVLSASFVLGLLNRLTPSIDGPAGA
jgi:hypothetical protein